MKYIKRTVIRELIDTAGESPRYWAAGMGIEIAETLYAKMVEKGMNQSSLARKMGVHRSYVSRFFSGDTNSTLEFIAKVAMALGMKRPILVLKEEVES